MSLSSVYMSLQSAHESFAGQTMRMCRCGKSVLKQPAINLTKGADVQGTCMGEVCSRPCHGGSYVLARDSSVDLTCGSVNGCLERGSNIWRPVGNAAYAKRHSWQGSWCREAQLGHSDFWEGCKSWERITLKKCAWDQPESSLSVSKLWTFISPRKWGLWVSHNYRAWVLVVVCTRELPITLHRDSCTACLWVWIWPLGIGCYSCSLHSTVFFSSELMSLKVRTVKKLGSHWG